MNEQKKRLAHYFAFFNEQRRHTSLGNDTPMAVYRRSIAAPPPTKEALPMAA